ncbi:cysteine proteinase [Armillaria gallica]|uniref:Cysteine proteinase n=1 Tax=Armillaria gallica TaxID=47427 RepID=A0A2H3CWN3_ARMGA|nr:cysteine proteinase [Armillaria gallica]
MLEYPWGISGGVSIKGEDFNWLRPGVYLNDNLIEFGLWHLQDQLGRDKSAIAKDIFVFSPFCTNVLKCSLRKYDDIRHWTSKIDIFAMTYLIILIHEDIHWYLAIICNPGSMILPAELKKESEVEGEERSNSGKGSAEHEIFTLDSLGSKHQGTMAALTQFLVLEASDKKGVKLTILQVPWQRNSYNCSIYLLHFVETFMSELSRYHKLMVSSCYVEHYVLMILSMPPSQNKFHTLQPTETWSGKSTKLRS